MELGRASSQNQKQQITKLSSRKQNKQGKTETRWWDAIPNLVSVPKGTSNWYKLARIRMDWKNIEKVDVQQWIQKLQIMMMKAYETCF